MREAGASLTFIYIGPVTSNPCGIKPNCES
jgi:hypothetical protein